MKRIKDVDGEIKGKEEQMTKVAMRAEEPGHEPAQVPEPFPPPGEGQPPQPVPFPEPFPPPDEADRPQQPTIPEPGPQ
jgi:hypothetical protein